MTHLGPILGSLSRQLDFVLHTILAPNWPWLLLHTAQRIAIAITTMAMKKQICRWTLSGWVFEPTNSLLGQGLPGHAAFIRVSQHRALYLVGLGPISVGLMPVLVGLGPVSQHGILYLVVLGPVWLS